MRWVYTAMHGVGWETASAVVEHAGYPQPDVVAEQISPDPAFPTVAFPNPEEPGAMDLAFQAAQAAGAEFIVANDPDADRVAVAVPGPDGWRRLTGNEIGLLLGARAARAAGGSDPSPARSSRRRALARSPGSTASTGTRRSRASSGSRARPTSCTASRRRSATS